MSVYLLMLMPYGCPSHDTDVLGVYANKSAANKAMKAYLKEYYEDGCPEGEVFVMMKKVED